MQYINDITGVVATERPSLSPPSEKGWISRLLSDGRWIFQHIVSGDIDYAAWNSMQREGWVVSWCTSQQSWAWTKQFCSFTVYEAPQSLAADIKCPATTLDDLIDRGVLSPGTPKDYRVLRQGFAAFCRKHHPDKSTSASAFAATFSNIVEQLRSLLAYAEVHWNAPQANSPASPERIPSTSAGPTGGGGVRNPNPPTTF